MERHHGTKRAAVTSSFESKREGECRRLLGTQGTQASLHLAVMEGTTNRNQQCPGDPAIYCRGGGGLFLEQTSEIIAKRNKLGRK